MSEVRGVELLPEIHRFITMRRAEFDLIQAERREELAKMARFVRDQLESAGVAQLTFICTHNSRRSHLSQVWAKVAADAYGWTAVRTYSGGTEATAMNPRVVASLRRTGFQIDADVPDAENPLYRVRYSDATEPLTCFSKVYDQAPNPNANYAAIMTCSSADQACPIVPGCTLRLPIRYEDPKVADGTPEESSVYDGRSRQICREMLFAMSQVSPVVQT